MALAVETRGLGKRYLLGERTASYGTLRDALAGAFSRQGRPRSELWALRDLDLRVDQGEALGVIGRNGSGKTTLLRVLGRITEPTTGRARIRGRSGALLEVGTGFHPELTGRENVYLSGAIMGMSRRDVRARFDAIVAFAEVEAFLDTPVKRYSSGMRLRLAFAVAAHLEPEVLLIDEVLAVGDVEFQRRCVERMSRLSTEGRTIVFVSHDLSAVTRLCSRAVWIDAGRVAHEGTASEAVEAYYATAAAAAGRAEVPVRGDVAVASVALTDGDGRPVARPRRDRPLWIEVSLITAQPVPTLDLTVYLLDARGNRIIDEAWSDQRAGPPLAPTAGEHIVRIRVPPILRATYYVVGVWVGMGPETFVHVEPLTFTVTPTADDAHEHATRDRVVQPPVEWSRSERSS